MTLPSKRIKLLLLGAYPRVSPHRTYASQQKRGPDGIRTWGASGRPSPVPKSWAEPKDYICYRREVPCFRYTTGPQKQYC